METMTFTVKLQDSLRLIEQFCIDCQLRGLTTETIRKYKSSVLLFSNRFPDSNMVTITNQMLQDFLAYLKFERAIKDNTIGQTFSALSAFYDYLVFEQFTNHNIILPFRKRYLRMSIANKSSPTRRLLTLEEMSQLIHSILDPRDKAIAVLLAKTGMRRGELLRIDVNDVNWTEYSILLKPTPKRSNRLVFFDDEAALTLRRWLRTRDKLNPKSEALFLSYQTSDKLSRNGAYNAVVKYAKRLSLHNSESPRLEDHFGPHCFRHWFTTHLVRNGMPREHVKELRGDRRKEAIDLYHHIDREQLRQNYLACIPKLGL